MPDTADGYDLADYEALRVLVSASQDAQVTSLTVVWYTSSGQKISSGTLDIGQLIRWAGAVVHLGRVDGQQPQPGGAAAIGRRRGGPGLRCSLPPSRARGGMRGAMSGAVMAASPQGRGRGGPEPGGVFKRCLVCGKFPRFWCPRGDLNPGSGGTSPNRGSITSPS